MRSAHASVALFLVASHAMAQPPDGYYDSASGLTGDELRAALHEIIDDHTRLLYTSSSADTWDVIHLADEAEGDESRILDLYRNRRFLKSDHWSSSNTSGWNREHSWPKSYGFTDDGECNYPYTDVHHLFASDPDYNEARGNIPYDWAPSGSEAFPVDDLGFANYRSGEYENGFWEVWPMRRGDVARAMFYMDVRYEGGTHGVTGCMEPDLRLTSNRADFVWSSSQNLSVAYMGILSTLLEWHVEDPPDEHERRRNDVVFGFQGNRNPFVDHPEFVCEIYACPSLPDEDPPSVPELSAVEVGRDHVTLFWSPSPDTDVDGYRVYRRSDSGGYEALTATPIQATSYTDATVTSGIEYGYAVSSVDTSSNESETGREVRATPGFHLRVFQAIQSGAPRVVLEWTGAETSPVDIWRNGVKVTSTENDSAWTDMTPVERSIYRVCDVDTTECSEDVGIGLFDRRRGSRR